jgi:hypothetical protein
VKCTLLSRPNSGDLVVEVARRFLVGDDAVVVLLVLVLVEARPD